MFPMSVGRSQESTRNLTSVKHILLWYVSPFFFIVFWPLICTTVGPVHSSLRPGSAVGEKMAKNGVKRHRKNWRPERWTEEKEKGGFLSPDYRAPIFFAFLPNCRAWSKAAFFYTNRRSVHAKPVNPLTKTSLQIGLLKFPPHEFRLTNMWFEKCPDCHVKVMCM